MTNIQRTIIRDALKGAGMKRTDFTEDPHNTGAYTETWKSTDQDVVTISWSPRNFDGTHRE